MGKRAEIWATSGWPSNLVVLAQYFF